VIATSTCVEQFSRQSRFETKIFLNVGSFRA
jgi:hypothetical protein